VLLTAYCRQAADSLSIRGQMEPNNDQQLIPVQIVGDNGLVWSVPGVQRHWNAGRARKMKPSAGIQ
jgi:hypothetical protein